MLKIDNLKDLEIKAYEMRIEVIKALQQARSGHVGGALGIADVLTFLYYNYLRHDPNNPSWAERDYFLMSNGHVCPIWYSLLAHSGYFPVEDLASLRKLGSHLQGHPSVTSTPGVENSSGPLGHGIGQAVGIALGLKLDGKNSRVYCLTSDGEHQEGAIWENIMIAAKYKLNNLTLIMDMNGIQIDGRVEDIMPLPRIKSVYESAGWRVQEINGHDYTQIQKSFESSEPHLSDAPQLIIMHTIPGKGISFMEGKYEFHDWKPEEGRPSEAIAELLKKIAQLQSENN
jgi:transketolase